VIRVNSIISSGVVVVGGGLYSGVTTHTTSGMWRYLRRVAMVNIGGGTMFLWREVMANEWGII